MPLIVFWVIDFGHAVKTARSKTVRLVSLHHIVFFIKLFCLMLLCVADTSHAKSNGLTDFFLSLWRFVKSKVEQGDPLQQGGQLVISQGKKDKYKY